MSARELGEASPRISESTLASAGTRVDGASERGVGATRLLIIAEVRLYREGLAQILGREQGVQVVSTAASRQDALSVIDRSEADIALVDMAMKESVETICAIVARAPDVKVIALAVPETDQAVIACAEAGAVAYVPREGSVRDLVVAVRGVARGEAQSSPHIVGSLLRRLAVLATERSGGRGGAPLTPRELQIVRLIERGYSNKDIAVALRIAVATVKNHVHHILEKTQVRRRVDAVAQSQRFGR
jgi:DNA-binding NarL/FixJ family response regulator